MATKEEVQKVRPVYDIIAAAWGIVKDHAGIEKRQALPETEKEWETVCMELTDLSQRGTTPGEKALAFGLAKAVFDYYSETANEEAIA